MHTFQVQALAAGAMEAKAAAIRHRAAQSTQGLIRLNVGGVEYTTNLATLTAVPDSYFSALFGGDWEQLKTPDGALFLDRDGEVSWVLNELHDLASGHAADTWSHCEMLHAAVQVRTCTYTSCNTFGPRGTPRLSACQLVLIQTLLLQSQKKLCSLGYQSCRRR